VPSIKEPAEPITPARGTNSLKSLRRHCDFNSPLTFCGTSCLISDVGSFNWKNSLISGKLISIGGGMSKKFDLESMSIDEMWQLHESLVQILSHKLTSEKRELEKRLAKLGQDMPARDSQPRQSQERTQKRRKYPAVLPRYRNPDNHTETWSGRGKQPRWLAAAITKGHSIEEFRIADVA